jgi:PBP1b-binding outer membrane lipoprotein LpoB
MLKKNLKSAISALFGALLIVGLAGCSAAGPNAQTRNVRQVTDGVEATSGSIKALNVLLVTQEDGSSVLVGTFVNSAETSDAITAITANGIVGEISVSTLDQYSGPAIFEGDSKNSSAKFPGLNAKPSDHVELEVTFATSAPMKMSALVRAKAEEFANVGN